MARHIACPFLPCSAEWWVAMDRSDVPLHKPRGLPSYVDWLPHCPGSLTRYLPDSDILSPRDREQMHLALTAYTNRVRSLHERSAADGGPMGLQPSRPYDDYFPGRPADATEPATGEAPALPVPEGVSGQSLGNQAIMDNARDNLRALVSLAINGFGQTQDRLARITNALDMIETLVYEAETQCDAAIALARAAVGDTGTAPEPAVNMVATAAVGRSTIIAGDGVRGMISLARSRVAMAYSSMQAASAHGNAYNRLP